MEHGHGRRCIIVRVGGGGARQPGEFSHMKHDESVWMFDRLTARAALF